MSIQTPNKNRLILGFNAKRKKLKYKLLRIRYEEIIIPKLKLIEVSISSQIKSISNFK